MPGPIDREVCCIIELCCGSNDKDVKALASMLATDAGLTPTDAKRAAEAMKAKFDLAPKGWGVRELIHKVGEAARELPYNP